MITHATAKRVFAIMFETGRPPYEIIAERGWWALPWYDVIQLVADVLLELPQAQDGQIVGEVLKRADGRADGAMTWEFVQIGRQVLLERNEKQDD